MVTWKFEIWKSFSVKVLDFFNFRFHQKVRNETESNSSHSVSITCTFKSYWMNMIRLQTSWIRDIRKLNRHQEGITEFVSDNSFIALQISLSFANVSEFILFSFWKVWMWYLYVFSNIGIFLRRCNFFSSCRNSTDGIAHYENSIRLYLFI